MTHFDIAQVLAGQALLTEPLTAPETEGVMVFDSISDAIEAAFHRREDTGIKRGNAQGTESNSTIQASTSTNPGVWVLSCHTIPHHGTRLWFTSEREYQPYVVSCHLLGAHTPRSPVTPETSALISALKLLALRKGLLQAAQIVALTRQLAVLVDADDPSEQRVSLLSLDGLISFLGQHHPVIHPNLSLTADGRFSASWQHGRRAKLTLTFDREGGDWVGVDLDAKRRAVGAFVVHSLAGITQPYRSWMNG